MINFILVDDDEYALRGLSQFFSHNLQEYQIIGTFTDATLALDFLRTHSVDVIITDIQIPCMNGIELIRIVRAENPEIPIIALSAYDNYSYVRDALLEGIVDYLLKPYDLNLLQAAIEKAARSVRVRRSDLVERERNDSLKKFRAAPRNLHPPEELRKPYFMGAFRLTRMTSRELTENAVRDIRFLFPENVLTLFCDGYTLFVAPEFEPDEAWMNRLTAVCEYYRQNHSAAAWFVYQTQCAAQDFTASEKLCQEMLRFLAFNQYGIVLNGATYVRYMQDQQSFSLQDYVSTQEVIHRILTHNTADLEDYIHRAWNQMRRNHPLFQVDQIRGEVIRLCIELEVELKRYFDQLDIQSPEESVSVSMYLSRASDIVSLGKRFAQIVCSIDVSSQGGKMLPNYILAAISFIEEHYMQPITLKEVAEHAYVNNWYLSAQFKKFMKMSMTEYISKVRINHAVKLLNDSDAKIYHVSCAVGFNDPSYFSTVFKAVMGITPREYQRQRAFENREDRE